MVFGRIILHCIDYFTLTKIKIAESANISVWRILYVNEIVSIVLVAYTPNNPGIFSCLVFLLFLFGLFNCHCSWWELKSGPSFSYVSCYFGLLNSTQQLFWEGNMWGKPTIRPKRKKPNDKYYTGLIILVSPLGRTMRFRYLFILWWPLLF